jgi:hypothetical protein
MVLLALFTVSAYGIVLTVKANTTTHASTLRKHCLIELAFERMIITIALFAFVSLATASRLPKHIVEQRQALFTVRAGCVMRALALAVDHAVRVALIILHAFDLNAATCVAIAQATATHDHLVHGIIILFFDFVANVEQVVAERVQFGEIYSQVGDLQQVLDFA